MMKHNTVSTIRRTLTNKAEDGDARFKEPRGVEVDGHGNIIVANTYEHRICKITPQGQSKCPLWRALARRAIETEKEASLGSTNPMESQWMGATTLSWLTQTTTVTIRKISPQGHVSTLAGTGVRDHRDGVALFKHPCGIAVDGDDNVIVAESSNHCIRKNSPEGHVSTLAGTRGVSSHRDGKGTVALLNHPCGLAVDRDDNIIVHG
jgi:DNA-binding beta-propeller fold protein YncE